MSDLRCPLEKVGDYLKCRLCGAVFNCNEPIYNPCPALYKGRELRSMCNIRDIINNTLVGPRDLTVLHGRSVTTSGIVGEPDVLNKPWRLTADSARAICVDATVGATLAIHFNEFRDEVCATLVSGIGDELKILTWRGQYGDRNQFIDLVLSRRKIILKYLGNSGWKYDATNSKLTL